MLTSPISSWLRIKWIILLQAVNFLWDNLKIKIYAFLRFSMICEFFQFLLFFS